MNGRSKVMGISDQMCNTDYFICHSCGVILDVLLSFLRHAYLLSSLASGKLVFPGLVVICE
jgi:hypothetical protein